MTRLAAAMTLTLASLVDPATVATMRPPVECVVEHTRALLRIPVPDAAQGESPASFLRALWGTEDDVVARAGRDTFKTLTLAAYEFLAAFHDGVAVMHFAPHDNQLERMRVYLSQFAALPWYAPHVAYAQEIARFASGGSIEMRVLTLGNARSAHVPVVAFDEADELDPNALRVAAHIAAGRDGRRGRTIHISTHNRARGVMSELVRNARASGRVRVLGWNYRATAERCPDSRSGTRPVVAWVDPGSFTEPRASDPCDGRHVRAEVFDGCLSCAIVNSCRGSLKSAAGVGSIEDLVKRRTAPLMTPPEWRSQVENEEPSVHGLVVPEFRRELSVHALAFDPTLPTVWSQDFGLDHLAVTLVGQAIPLGHRPLLADGTRGAPNQIRGRKHVLAEHVVRGQAFHPGIADWLAANWVPRFGWPSRFVIDPSGAPAIGAARLEATVMGRTAARTIALEKADNRVRPGILRMRGDLTPVGDGSQTRMRIDPSCGRFVEELETCRNRQHPDGTYESDCPDKAKGGDDALDAGRYLVAALDAGVGFTSDECAESYRAGAAQGGWF